MAFLIDEHGHMTEVPDDHQARPGQQVLPYNPFVPGAYDAAVSKGYQAPNVSQVKKGYKAPSSTAAPPTAAGTTSTPTEQLPSDVGITFGQYKDYKAQITQALGQLGFGDLAEEYRTMNPLTDVAHLQEIVHFADAKLDMSGILNFYKNRPDLVAINPGLPYDMSKEEYGRATEELAGYGTSIGGAPSDQAVKESLREKMSTSETEAGLSDLFRREGRTAQTAKDVAAFRTRPKITTQDDRAGAAGSGGTTPGVGKQQPVAPFARK